MKTTATFVQRILMSSIGPIEIVIVLALALLVFGPQRLPQMGRTLGRAMRDFRKASDEITGTFSSTDDDEDGEQSREDAGSDGEGSREDAGAAATPREPTAVTSDEAEAAPEDEAEAAPEDEAEAAPEEPAAPAAGGPGAF